MNWYSILADMTVAVHLSYMGYVVIGQLLILIGWPLHWRWIRNPWFRLSHLAMILIVAVEAVVSFECPLTTLEHYLRREAGQRILGTEVEGASFTGQMMRNVQFLGDKYSDEAWVNRSFYVAAGVIVATAFLVPPRFRRAPAPPGTSR